MAASGATAERAPQAGRRPRLVQSPDGPQSRAGAVSMTVLVDPPIWPRHGRLWGHRGAGTAGRTTSPPGSITRWTAVPRRSGVDDRPGGPTDLAATWPPLGP